MSGAQRVAVLACLVVILGAGVYTLTPYTAHRPAPTAARAGGSWESRLAQASRPYSGPTAAVDCDNAWAGGHCETIGHGRQTTAAALALGALLVLVLAVWMLREPRATPGGFGV